MSQVHIMNRKAFTLMELIIVVAIIGILATIGIPTYRRMVQKAKKIEAKALLGGIFTVESAFYSEFGAYGSNLLSMGFEIAGMVWWQPDGPDAWGVYRHPGTYSVGFFLGSNCRPEKLGVGNPPAPSVFEFMETIEAVHPNYYSNRIHGEVFLRENISFQQGFCRAGFVPGDGTSFLATASGVIAPGIPITTTNSALVDQWTLDQDRNLRNVVDGIQ